MYAQMFNTEFDTWWKPDKKPNIRTIPIQYAKGSRKKSYFFSGPATKALTPPPLGIQKLQNFSPRMLKFDWKCY